MRKLVWFILLISTNISAQNFIVIADPHCIVSQPYRLQRLTQGIQYINDHLELKVDFIVIVGDIALDETSIDNAFNVFKNSTIPCVPIIGDNEWVDGIDRKFYQVFRSYYDSYLKVKIPQIEAYIKPIPTPPLGALEIRIPTIDYCNLAFVINGVKFVTADCAQKAEYATLRDVTKNWLQQQTFNASKLRYGPYGYDYINNMVVFSHHPLAFSQVAEQSLTSAEVAQLSSIFSSNRATINSNFCGHAHVTFGWTKEAIIPPIMNTYLTESLLDHQSDPEILLYADQTATTINAVLTSICGGLADIVEIVSGVLLGVAVKVTYTCPTATGQALLDAVEGILYNSKKITMTYVQMKKHDRSLGAKSYFVKDGYLHDLRTAQTDVGADLAEGKIYNWAVGRPYKEFYPFIQYLRLDPARPATIGILPR